MGFWSGPWEMDLVNRKAILQKYYEEGVTLPPVAEGHSKLGVGAKGSNFLLYMRQCCARIVIKIAKIKIITLA
jgi:hypothetical protein